MLLRLDRAIIHRPRLVLDVREWFGTVFAPEPPLEITLPDGTTETATAIVRPRQLLTVTATPGTSAGARWPFPGTVELVTPRTPVGLLAFYGRVRSPGGPLRRMPLLGATCDLRIVSEGLRPVDLIGVAIPGPDEVTLVREVFLYPTGDLPNALRGPTTLTGTVSNTNGSGFARVQVVPDTPGLPTAVCDANGVWVMELDPPAGPRLSQRGSVDLTFQDPDGVELRRARVDYLPRQLNRFPRTVLRGSVRDRRTGREVVGAKVTVSIFPGETVTRLDGRWTFCPPLSAPLTGSQPATITVTPPGGAAVTRNVTVFYGEADPQNTVPTIDVP